MSANYTPIPKKKTSPLVWVLVGILGFIVLIGVLAVGAGVFVYYKAKQAGFDPDLWARNPGAAAAKMIAATHPDAEVVKLDERRGIVTLRSKRTGKTVTLNFEDIRSGRVSFESDEGERVSIEGESGSVRVKSSEGDVRVGAAAKLPSWVPVYTGARPESSVSAQGDAGDEGAYQLTTRDSAADVERFYNAALTREGFSVETAQRFGATVLTAENDDGRKVTVTATAAGGGTRVHVVFTDKQ